MAEIKGFFFDLDGTLVDTHEANYGAYEKSVADLHGIHLEEELKAHIKSGMTSKDFLPLLISGITDDEVDAVNERKKEEYPNHLHKSIANEYLVRFLENIANHYVTVLVTTAKKANAEAVLKEHGIEDYFNFTIYGEDVDNTKPHPEAYIKALQLSGLHEDEVIVFEDSSKGIESAEAAGLNYIRIKDFI